MLSCENKGDTGHSFTESWMLISSSFFTNVETEVNS